MPARQRWARWLLWLVLVIAIAVGAGSRLLDSLPSTPSHASVAPSVLYDRYGTPIVEIGPSVPHASLGLEDMAPALVDAMVAVLDPSFLEREGVDAATYAASLRRARGDPEPASEGIMRRYLDIVHHARDGSLDEARMLLAELRLGRELSRPEILERFANIAYLGRGAYGVHAAANAWYGVAASDLTVTQAAFIASLVDAPWGVDAASGPPDDPNQSARLGRDRVLLAMFEHEVLTSDELAAGRSTRVEAGIRPATGLSVGAADPEAPDVAAGGFVRMLIADAGLGAAVGWAYIELVERYGIHRVVTGGLHVTTSLDLGAQRAALRAVRRQIGDTTSGDIGVDVVVLDRSGDVRVLVTASRATPAVDIDVASPMRPRPVGDLLGAAAADLQRWIAPDVADEVVAQAADAAQVAAAFSVAATGGEERTPRIVLETGDGAPSLSLTERTTDRWLMQRTAIGEPASISDLRAGMATFTLPWGASALGRAGVSAQTGDAWFAGWTDHYTAAVRVTASSPPGELDAASRANELFTTVLDTLHSVP